MQDDERRLPVVVSAVTRSTPKPLIVTGVLIGLVVLLGFFLILSRPWFADAPSIVGAWVADVDYPSGVSHSERFEFRVVGSALSGSASYLGARRVIEDGQVDDTTLEFRTRSRDRIGNEQHELVHEYVGRLSGDTIVFSLQTTDDADAGEAIIFEARRP